MSYIVDLSGMRFGRWTVLNRLSSGGRGKYLCRCDCGTVKEIFGSTLKSGRANSCGCLNTELVRERNFKHGESKTPLYCLWIDMKKRCYNPNFHQFKDYGGRGIEMSTEWKNDFVAFKEWALDNGYSDELTIDRIDNDAGYSPDNCRFVSMKVQNNNKRSNRMLTVGEVTKTLAQWSETSGVNESVIRSRLARGWSTADAIWRPAREMRKCVV